MKHSFVIVLLIFSLCGIFTLDKSSWPNGIRHRKAYKQVSDTIGRDYKFASETEADAYELETFGTTAADSTVTAGEAAAAGGEILSGMTAEGFAIGLGEFCAAISPAGPILLLFSGALNLGGILEKHLNEAHAIAKSITGSNEQKPQICRINIKTELYGGYDKWPLVLEVYDNTFKDVNGNGDIDFLIGDTVKISCPGSDNLVTKLGVSDAVIVCHAGAIFEYGGRLYSFYELGCNKLPKSVEKRFRGYDSTLNNLARYDIGFDLNGGGFVPQMELFYDNKLLKYVKHRIGYEVGDNPDEAPQKSEGQTWKQGIHPKSGLVNLYKGNTIREKMTTLIGIFPANHYFGDWSNNKRQIDKGHLAPKTDFPYASQQSATFYYLNAAPQFHAFNAQNWYFLEKGIRQLASEAGKMTIYSGIQGVLELFDSSKKIYLDTPVNEFPVPYYFWKVIHLDINDKKMAFIGMNTPRDSYFGKDDEWYSQNFCRQKCWDDDFRFLSDGLTDPNQKDQKIGGRDPTRGVVLCCLYDNDFIEKTGINIPIGD